MGRWLFQCVMQVQDKVSDVMKVSALSICTSVSLYLCMHGNQVCVVTTTVGIVKPMGYIPRNLQIYDSLKKIKFMVNGSPLLFLAVDLGWPT